MSSEGSVTVWIEDLKGGDPQAAQRLWERYFQRLVGLARKRLRNAPRRAVDEEDVVVSVFDTFCRRADQGRFPQLRDRDDLWRLLVTITVRKAINQAKREGRLKRGGRNVLGNSVVAGVDSREVIPSVSEVVGDEPTPELAAMVAEQYREMLNTLDDATLREIAVWKTEGYTNDEIANKMGRAKRTVARKLALIRKKLEASTRD